jgi:predicted RNA binding protein YcfA (HicA-like mRNA interferase family)
MSERFPRLTAKEVEKVLGRNGFELVGQSGCHRKWWHTGRRATVIVPSHAGRMLPIGTMKQIVKTSGILLRDWKA